MKGQSFPILSPEACNRSRQSDALSQDCMELKEERAAIMEFDGGLTREEAEKAAAELLGLRSDDCAVPEIPLRQLRSRWSGDVRQMQAGIAAKR